MARAQATSRQKEFYRKQRLDDESRARAGSETAQAEVNKIYGKLGKKAPNYQGGTDRVDQAILGIAPMLADPLVGLARGLGARFAGRGALKAGEDLIPKALQGAERKALPKAPERLALPKGSAASRTRPLVKAKTAQRIARERTAGKSGAAVRAKGQVQRALPKPQRELPKGYKQPRRVTAGKPRAKQTAPRAKGTNPRASGSNVRARRAKKA